jgi:hypothetical protein
MMPFFHGEIVINVYVIFNPWITCLCSSQFNYKPLPDTVLEVYLCQQVQMSI